MDSGREDAPTDTGPSLPREIGPADRPAGFRTPRAHDGTTPLPAVILLHGYSASSSVQDLYFGLTRNASLEGFYVVLPDGMTDGAGNQFWNATPACCNFGGSSVDDVAYLTALIDELESLVPVSDVYLIGHSNGGFMSYRMACERAERITGIVSLAGSDFLGDSDCVPDRPVSVLQIHGSLDGTIPIDGMAGAYPSATDVVARWASRNGCEPTSATGDALDLESEIAGAESEVERYDAGCDAHSELWTIVGGSHVPTLTTEFTPTVLDWLRSQAR